MNPPEAYCDGFNEDLNQEVSGQSVSYTTDIYLMHIIDETYDKIFIVQTKISTVVSDGGSKWSMFIDVDNSDSEVNTHCL